MKFKPIIYSYLLYANFYQMYMNPKFIVRSYRYLKSEKKHDPKFILRSYRYLLVVLSNANESEKNKIIEMLLTRLK